MEIQINASAAPATDRQHLRLVFSQPEIRSTGPDNALVPYSDWHRLQLSRAVQGLVEDFARELTKRLEWQAGFECSDARSGLVNPRAFTTMLESITLRDAVTEISFRLAGRAAEISVPNPPRAGVLHFSHCPDVLVSRKRACGTLNLEDAELQAMLDSGALPQPFMLLGQYRWRASILGVALAKARGVSPDVIMRRRPIDSAGEVDPQGAGWHLPGSSLNKRELASCLAVPGTRLDGLIQTGRVPAPLERVDHGDEVHWCGTELCRWLHAEFGEPWGRGRNRSTSYGRERLMRKHELFRMLELSEKQFSSAPDFPRSIQLDNRPCWRLSDVMAWLELLSPTDNVRQLQPTATPSH